jgi:RNA polymerase sigma-70 factor (ECF subfamily)
MSIIPIAAARPSLPPEPAHDAGTSEAAGLQAAEDAVLFGAMATGEKVALDVLVCRLWEPLVRYAFRLVGDEDVAADVAQETFRRLWERRAAPPVPSSAAYVFRIARNLALDHVKLRRNRHRLRREHGSALIHPPRTPEEDHERDRLSDAVDEAIQGLSPRRREAFTLVYLRDLSYADAARVMGVSVKTVEKQLGSACSHLRRVLRPILRDCAERSR